MSVFLPNSQKPGIQKNVIKTAFFFQFYTQNMKPLGTGKGNLQFLPPTKFGQYWLGNILDDVENVQLQANDGK